MPCPTRIRLSPYLDGELAIAEKNDVSAHLASCPSCRREIEGMLGIGALLKNLPQRELPSGFISRLKSRREPAAPESPPGLRPSQYIGIAAAALSVAVLAYRLWAPPPPASTEPAAPLIAAMAAPAPELPENRPAEIGNRGDVFAAKAASSDGKITNETLHAHMQQEAQDMGIRGIAAKKTNDQPQEEGEPPPPMSEAGRIAAAQAYARQIEAMRRAMAADQAESVAIAGQTSPLLGSKERSGGKPLGDLAWSGEFGGTQETATRTIMEKGDWLSTWKSVSKEPAPEIDFSRYEIVAVFLGVRPTGGYLPEIAEITRTESAIVVRYREKAPAPGRTPPEGQTSPFALRAIPRSALPVRFEFEE